MLTSIGETFERYECSAGEVWEEPGKHRTYARSITFTHPYRTLSFEELHFNDVQHAGQVPKLLFKTSLTASTVSLPSARRKIPKKNIYGSSMITFRVGNGETQDFTIHEDLVTSASHFVALTMKSGWKEAQQRIIPLPEDEPAIFEIYQQWLYARKIFTANFSDPETHQKEYRVLVDAYIFGDKFLDIDFKDAVTDSIISKLRRNRLFDPGVAKIVYSNTLTSAPLRRLILDIFWWAGTPEWVELIETDDLAQAEFMKDLLKMQAQRPMPKSAPFLGSTCHYHEHVDGTCYKGSTQQAKACQEPRPQPQRQSPLDPDMLFGMMGGGSTIPTFRAPSSDELPRVMGGSAGYNPFGAPSSDELSRVMGGSASYNPFGAPRSYEEVWRRMFRS